MIRDAQAADAARIAEIYNHYVAHTCVSFETDLVGAAEMANRISEITHFSLPWLILEHEENIIGYTYASRWHERQAYQNTVETTIYLEKSRLGQGFGRLLYAKLLSELISAGFHTAIGVIALPNEASVGLHEALGFQKAAYLSEMGYKNGKWIDVGCWQLMLENYVHARGM